MPRFFKRIFSDHLFRRDATAADVSDIQRSRRVLVRPSTTGLYDQSALFDAQLHAEEMRALRDGASVADSCDAQLPILEGATAGNVGLPRRKSSRVRRKLSKRHRMPV